MRNLQLEAGVERDLRIIAHIEESKRRDPDRDKRLADTGSVYAHPDRCSIYDTPIPYILAQGGGLSRFNPKRSWEFFRAGCAGRSKAIGSTQTGWQSIPVPKNASMALLIAAGAGSGGGAGLTAATGNAKGGGGGGASGSVAKLLIPTRFLPSILWYYATLGGLGGIASTNAGGIGTVSFITDSGWQLGTPTSVFGDIILRSGAASATGGAAGTASGASAGGASETIATSGDVYLAMGIWQTVASVCPGAAGGNAVGPTVGGNLTWGGTNGAAPFCGGAGGGGADSGTNTPTAGGAINTNGLMQSVAAGAAGVNVNGGAGGDGQSIQIGGLQGFGSNGGGGGGAATGVSSPVGGRGGNAGDYCSGGGGGGAGITFGPGGNGGRGFVYVIFT